jgi:phosphoribosylamine--glycine ligase / phosphoribosylformylglycinamidine cyclo-ligase
MLFTGLMMTKSGPRVLEYNVRGGDPETQTLLPLLSPESDLAEIMVACTEHWLDGLEVKIEPKYAATIVAAAKGYPSSYQKGTPITFDNSEKGTSFEFSPYAQSSKETQTLSSFTLARHLREKPSKRQGVAS